MCLFSLLMLFFSVLAVVLGIMRGSWGVFILFCFLGVSSFFYGVFRESEEEEQKRKEIEHECQMSIDKLLPKIEKILEEYVPHDTIPENTPTLKIYNMNGELSNVKCWVNNDSLIIFSDLLIITKDLNDIK